MGFARSLMLGGAAALLAFAQGAWACEGPNTLYEDDFSTVDQVWGNYDGTKIDGGKLTLSPSENSGYALENQTSYFEDADICVDVVQDNQDPTTGYAGILFWGTDYDNYYTLDIATNGYVRVSRKQNGRWLTPVAWTLIQGVNEGTASNRARVTLKGNMATVTVNDVEVTTFKGRPPEGGSLIGVYASSPKDSTGTYDFDNFKVTDVAQAGQADQPPAAEAPAPPAPAPADEPAPAPKKPGGAAKMPGAAAEESPAVDEPPAAGEPAKPAPKRPGKPGAPKVPG